MNPYRYVRVVSTFATSLAFLGAGLVANAQTIPPNGPGLPAGAVFDSDPESATFRTFTWTPTAAQIGQHQITFWVTDGIDTDSETITITVTAGTDLNGNSDFSGDGKADVLYQSASSLALQGQAYNGSGGASGGMVNLNMGAAGLQLLSIADMNGDLINDYVVRKLDGSNSYEVRLRDANGNVTATRSYNPGGADWRIVGAYDQNKDGYGDLILQNVTTGRVTIWYMNGSGALNTFATLVSSIADYRIAAVGDLNADGLMDLIWQKVTGTSTELRVWYLNAAGEMTSHKLITTLEGGYRCVGLGDYNSDNVNDIVWQKVSTGQVVAWYMSPTAAHTGTKVLAAESDLRVANWQWEMTSNAVVHQDENGDGKADMLWQHGTNGHSTIWRMNGAWGRGSFLTLVSANQAPGKLMALADMDADGINDYVWCRQESGNNVVTIWLMNANRTRKSWYVVSTAIASTYTLAGVGDMNSDAYPDLLWQEDATGKLVAWHMNGAGKPLSFAVLVPSMSGYRVRVVADMNQDGKADLIWQRAYAGNTETVVWYMNGAGVRTSLRFMTTVAQDWRMGCAGDYNGDALMDVVLFNTTTKQAVGWQLNAQNAATRYVSVASGMGDYSIAGL